MANQNRLGDDDGFYPSRENLVSEYTNNSSRRWLGKVGRGRFFAAIGFALCWSSVAADVTRDGSIGPGVSVQPTGPNFEIPESFGERRGGNLLHSFDKFSLSAGERATFRGSDSINNVISRVTGSEASSINGLLRSTIKGANFYLLNPNGILFGPKVNLDIDGAFRASTAEALLFSTGEVLEARTDGRVPVLATAVPSAFGFFGESAAPIVLDGGRLSRVDELGLHAETIDIRGGAQIDGGDIVLRGNRSVTLSGTSEQAGSKGLGSFISGRKSVEIRAPVVEVQDGGRITVESAPGGTDGVRNISIAASESLTLSGTDGFGSGSSLDASSQTGTNEGSIKLEASSIKLRDGAKITARADPRRLARQVRLTDSDLPWLDEQGKLSTEGKFDEIYRWFEEAGFSLDADIPANTNAAAGSIKITASESLVLSGTDGHGVGSAIDTSSRVIADSNSIWIESPVIRLKDGARVTTLLSPPTPDAQWLVYKDVGIFRINFIRGDRNSDIRRPVRTRLQQGDITIFADSLNLQDSSISATTVGDSGNVVRSAGSVFIIPPSGTLGGLPAGSEKGVALLDSRISANAGNGAGDGGSITIVNEFVVLANSRITAQADAGKGGNIRVIARKFFASADSVIDASAGPAGIDGRVVNEPQRVDVGELTSLSTEFLNDATQMRPPCAANGEHGSFTVAPRRGLPLSPERLLAAIGTNGAGATHRVVRDASFTTSSSAVGGVAVGMRGGQFHEVADEPSVISGVGADGPSEVERGNTLRALADAQQLRGEFEASVETLRRALLLAEQADDPGAIASSLGGLGNALLATGHAEHAEQLFTRAIALAKQTNKPELAAGILNNLGNQQAVNEAYIKALQAYLESAHIAQETGDSVQEAKALSNAARVALQLRQIEQASMLLERAFELVNGLSQSRDQAVIDIHVAKSYAELSLVPEHRKLALLRAYTTLQRSVENSEVLEDDLNRSYALGNLGALYQSQGHYEEALYLTRRALHSAERVEAPESIYRWHWQEGRLLWAQGRAGEAIAALRRAVAILEETQQETLAQYGSAAVYFRKTIAPVYLQLVDTLLQRAVAVSDASKAQELRVEARDTIERFKAAELRDYFRDECVADLEAKTKNLEAVSTTAAVVYPILLPERLELLVSLPSGLQQYSVPVPSQRFAEAIRELREQLEGRSEMQAVSRQLYEWLVQPYAARLVEADIDTLVFVPDGLLRTIPLAALHDGERYLIEQYRVAVTPGLSLIDPKPINRSRARPLLAGLSKSVQGFPALTHVPEELSAVHREYGGEMLLDEDFTLDKVQKSFEKKVPTIVHIASHGRFTGDPKSSFLLTYDGRLSMDRLSAYVGLTQYRDQPLELLVLSACETAASDERAALGLAGVGVQAGARSALGSLWSISDEATSHLVAEFYKQLKDPGVSKAQALQQAQLKLLDSPRFTHPFYWSAFLLINNWL